jgi:hypothetical protein
MSCDFESGDIVKLTELRESSRGWQTFRRLENAKGRCLSIQRPRGVRRLGGDKNSGAVANQSREKSDQRHCRCGLISSSSPASVSGLVAAICRSNNAALCRGALAGNRRRSKTLILSNSNVGSESP